MSDLKERAKELGIRVDYRWDDKRIQQEIDKLAPVDEKPEAEPVVDSKPVDEPVVKEASEETKAENNPDTIVTEEKKPKRDQNEFTVKNIAPNPWAIDRTILQPGKSYTMTERDLADKRLQAKVQNAISQGKLERC